MWLNFISIQSQYSTYGIIKAVEKVSLIEKINSKEYLTQKVILTKFDDGISVYRKKSEKSSFPSRFQGVQAIELYDFYGIYADSDKLDGYKKSTEKQLILNLSKYEYDYYCDLLKSANNNDEFIIEFYVDEKGINLGYIDSIQYVKKEYLQLFSVKISMKEKSDVYVFTKTNKAEFNNMNWLLIKDGEIQKNADADKINEFYLLKDVPQGTYTVLLCVNYNANTKAISQLMTEIQWRSLKITKNLHLKIFG